MKILDDTSLYKTIDNALHAELFGLTIPRDEKEEIGKWITKRFGMKGSYDVLYAPSEKDFSHATYLFTGEPIKSYAATAHILGEEAMILLQKWQLKNKEINRTLENAKKGWELKIRKDEERINETMGFFCCGKCSNTYWRGLHFGCLERSDERIIKGLRMLHQLRDEHGKWKRFPFYHTVWTLSDFPYQQAKDELQYIIPVMKRLLKKTANEDNMYQQRRRLIMQNAIINLEK